MILHSIRGLGLKLFNTYDDWWKSVQSDDYDNMKVDMVPTATHEGDQEGDDEGRGSNNTTCGQSHNPTLRNTTPHAPTTPVRASAEPSGRSAFPRRGGATGQEYAPMRTTTRQDITTAGHRDSHQTEPGEAVGLRRRRCRPQPAVLDGIGVAASLGVVPMAAGRGRLGVVSGSQHTINLSTAAAPPVASSQQQLAAHVAPRH